MSRSTDISGPSSDFSSSSPLLGTPLTPTFQLEQSQQALPYGVTQLDVLSNTPPPRPPKPVHFSDRRGDELGTGALQNGHAGICRPQVTLVPRRISLSSLDNMRNWKGECADGRDRAAHAHREVLMSCCASLSSPPQCKTKCCFQMNQQAGFRSDPQVWLLLCRSLSVCVQVGSSLALIPSGCPHALLILPLPPQERKQ